METTSKWLDEIYITFSKINKTPITNEDVDCIYEHLDRDCLINIDPVETHKATIHQENITWKNWKQDLRSFCQKTKEFKVSADATDEYGNKDSFLS